MGASHRNLWSILFPVNFLTQPFATELNDKFYTRLTYILINSLIRVHVWSFLCHTVTIIFKFVTASVICAVTKLGLQVVAYIQYVLFEFILDTCLDRQQLLKLYLRVQWSCCISRGFCGRLKLGVMKYYRIYFVFTCSGLRVVRIKSI